MARSIVVALCCLVMLATLAFVPESHAQDNTGLQLVVETTLPGSRDVKFPHIAAGFGGAHATGVYDEETVAVWSKAELAGEFGGPVVLGTVEGSRPDWLVTSTALDAAGNLYAVWTNESEDRIYLRIRDTAGNWGPRRRVADGNFPVFVETTVAKDGTIFVAWLEPGRPARYRFSSNQGLDWSATASLGDPIALSTQFDLTAGPNGEVGVAWTASSGDSLQIFGGFWNGSSFDIRRITRLGTNYANPTIGFGPSGTPYVAWRSVDSEGVYYAERQPDGSWPSSFLASGDVKGRINFNVDVQGNFHVTWVAIVGGASRPFYAFKPFNAQFRGPLASNASGSLFHADSAVSTDVQLLTHMVYERFGGGGLTTGYSLWRAEGNIFNAEPDLENGAALVGGKETVTVTFKNVRGGMPDQVRWRWGSAPSDDDPNLGEPGSDSDGWVAYTNPLTVPIPAAIRNATDCQPATLFTQVRSSTTGLVEAQAKSDGILVDTIVEASAGVSNPFLNLDAAPLPAQLQSVAGINQGDPRFTRIPLVFLDVTSDGDCSELKTVGIGRSAETIDTTVAISNTGYRGFVPLPDLANLQEGPVPVVIQIADGAGNQRNFTSTIVFDETGPTINTGAPGAILAEPFQEGGDLLQNLSFENLGVSDEQLGGRGFWGMTLAVSRTPLSDPARADLDWTVVSVPSAGNSFTIEGFSLATGLAPEEITPGNYYVYARFFDAAGNLSDDALSVTVNSQAQPGRLYLPAIRN